MRIKYCINSSVIYVLWKGKHLNPREQISVEMNNGNNNLKTSFLTVPTHKSFMTICVNDITSHISAEHLIKLSILTVLTASQRRLCLNCRVSTSRSSVILLDMLERSAMGRVYVPTLNSQPKWWIAWLWLKLVQRPRTVSALQTADWGNIRNEM